MKYYAEYQDKRVALLSDTEAMSCKSLSIVAGSSCPGAVYGEGTICQGCYAQIGRYNCNNVMTAQWVRYMWLKENLRTVAGTWHIITQLANAINAQCKNGYFRFFDSGDVFSVRMAYVIQRVCELTPTVKHWLPTRSWHLEGPLGEAVKRLGQVKNLTVRPSALYVNQAAPLVEGLARGSGVVDPTVVKFMADLICPKSKKGGSCESNGCRSCWDRPTKSVYYYQHSIGGRHNKLVNVTVGKIPVLRAKYKEQFAGRGTV